MRSVSSVVPGSQLGARDKRLRACFLNASGQCSSHGSGSNNAINTARDEASGRRAHHRCSVEGCPCRIDFSRTACFETSAMGKSTSANRLHSRGIMKWSPAWTNSRTDGRTCSGE